MKIEWRQLVVVAVLAVVFGGGAGYLGGRYSGGAEDTQIVAPRYSPAPPQNQTDSFADYQRQLQEKDLERRLKCIEGKAQEAMDSSSYGGFRLNLPCY